MSYTVGERERRPWGTWEVLAVGADHVVKRIVVTAMHRTSLQRHLGRSETWTVVSGKGYFWLNGRRHGVLPGDVMAIPRRAIHRIEAHQDTDLVLVEVQLGRCSEGDIERIEDDYHRT